MPILDMKKNFEITLVKDKGERVRMGRKSLQHSSKPVWKPGSETVPTPKYALKDSISPFVVL